MDIILTILGYVAIVLQWGALYIGLPIVLLYFVYRGIVKPIVSLVRKSNRSSFPTNMAANISVLFFSRHFSSHNACA